MHQLRRSDGLAQVRYDDGDEVKYLLPDEAKELRVSPSIADPPCLRHAARHPRPLLAEPWIDSVIKPPVGIWERHDWRAKHQPQTGRNQTRARCPPSCLSERPHSMRQGAAGSAPARCAFVLLSTHGIDGSVDAACAVDCKPVDLRVHGLPADLAA